MSNETKIPAANEESGALSQKLAKLKQLMLTYPWSSGAALLALDEIIALAAAPAATPAFDVEQMLRDCVPGGDVCDPQRVADSLREWFAATQPQATEREALSEERAVTANSVMRTAPARIWLNLFDTTVDTDGERLFPEDHEGVTWAEDEVGDYDVQYIRADLAGINTKG